MTYDVEEIIRQRKSVRSYENRPLSQSDRAAVIKLIEETIAQETPFPARIRMQ